MSSDIYPVIQGLHFFELVAFTLSLSCCNVKETLSRFYCIFKTSDMLWLVRRVMADKNISCFSAIAQKVEPLRREKVKRSFLVKRPQIAVIDSSFRLKCCCCCFFFHFGFFLVLKRLIEFLMYLNLLTRAKIITKSL